MHGFHEADVGDHRFLVGGDGIGQQGRRAHGVLDGVQQGQAGEDADGQLLLLGRQGRPGGDVVGQRDLFRQPEVAGQAIPHLQ
ncbi:Phosphate regulon sensor protein PhoR (SphS), partial [Corchorus olitorius]